MIGSNPGYLLKTLCFWELFAIPFQKILNEFEFELNLILYSSSDKSTTNITISYIDVLHPKM
jgi:hypothetical protein